jgi:serine/threonine protein kinase
MYLKKYGPYQVEDLLGEGGTGAVLRGFHEVSNRPVALKVPKLPRLHDRQALRREVGILSRMNRAQLRGVVRIFDHGTTRGVPWYAMELLDGRSLRSLKEQIWATNGRDVCPIETSDTIGVDLFSPTAHRMPARETLGAYRTPASNDRLNLPFPAGGQLARALDVMLRIADVLARVHGEGVIHGDLTPTNILFRDEADPVLIDFGTGLAQLAPDSLRELPVATPLGLGTPAYLAPEVLRGEIRDARCDLYAFGCMLYELLTGSRPFSASDPRDICKQQLYAAPVRPSELVAQMPAPLEELVLSLLVKDPVLRTPRADDVCRTLASLLPHQSNAFRETRDHTTLYRARLRGREELLGRLATLVSGVAQGRGGFVLLSGPSGIGKTRTMNELAARASAAQVVRIWCRANKPLAPEAQEMVMPSSGLETFTAVFEHVVETEEGEGHSGLPEGVVQCMQAVSRVVTPLISGWTPLPEPSSQPPARARSLAFDGLLALFRHVAGSSGLLLLIDDLQWADELSTAFLRQHAHTLVGLPVLVVANYRTEGAQLERDADLATLADLHVPLRALEPRDIERVAKDILATDTLPAGLFAFLHKHSAGNPFFVAEYTRAAVETTLLRQHGGGWTFDVDRADELTVPSSLDGLLVQRVQRLSEPARRALRQASVLGNDFDAACFESLVTSTSLATELLEELVAREILQVAPPAHYRFTHDALREAQERTLLPEERRRYHALAATQLERRGPEGREGTLGYHWACAGEPRQALDYLERAAADACARHTLERASDLYRLGIKQCLQLGSDPEVRERLTRLTEALADVLRQQARHVEARERLEQLLEWCPAEQRLVRARIWRKIATSHWTVHEYARAANALDHAEEELMRAPAPPDAERSAELIEIRLGRFEQLYFSGKVGPTLDSLIERLALLLDQYGSNDQQCRYYFMAASNVMLKQRYAFTPEALVFAERGLGAAVSVAPQRIAMARFILGYALMLGSRAQCQSALAYFEAAGQEAERIGEATLLSRVRTYHAIVALRVGDVDATELLADLALEAAKEAQLQPYLGAARTCQGWVAWRRGDARRARELLEAGRECWRGSAHDFPFSNLSIFPLLDLAFGADDFAAAHSLLLACDTGLPALPGPLCGAVHDAIQALDEATPVAASNALARVLHIAHELAFA